MQSNSLGVMHSARSRSCEIGCTSATKHLQRTSYVTANGGDVCACARTLPYSIIRLANMHRT